MQTLTNNKLLLSISSAVIIAFLIILAWLFGDYLFSTLVSITVPKNSIFTIWQGAFVMFWSCFFAFLAEKLTFKKVVSFNLIFSIIWLTAGYVSLYFFSFGLAVLPVIVASFASVFIVYLKKLWTIDKKLTNRLLDISTAGSLLEGKSADLRIESSLQLLETIFSVSEIVVFRNESKGRLTPIGRARTDKNENSTSSRLNSWQQCVTFCDEVIKTRQTQIEACGTNECSAKIALPLICQKSLIGVLYIDIKKDFEEEDQNLLEAICSQLARNLQRKDLQNTKLPLNTWWSSYSTETREKRIDITRLIDGIIKEQSFGTIAGSHLKEAHAVAYLDGTLSYLNQRMKILANLKAKDIQNLDLFALLARFKTDVFNDPSLAIRRVMQTGDSFKCELDFPDTRKTLSMQITLVHVSSQDDRIHQTKTQTVPACFLITFRNISALKENEKLRSDMVHLMSHELRTPITSIQGFAEMLLLEDGLPEDSKNYLNTIAAESQRASKILTNFLSVANLQQSDKQEVIKTPVKVNNLVREVIKDYSKTAKLKRIRIVEKQSKQLAPIAADRGLITKAISHLLDNAIRYSPERTSVMISTILEADFLRVDVEDRGYGIPKGEQEKIWNKFYRVAHDGQEKQEDTTGLGLSLVKEIVEQHNGEVGVKSVVGRGSRFSFRLPRL